MISEIIDLEVSGFGSYYKSNLDILRDTINGVTPLEQSVMLLAFYNPGYHFDIRTDIRPDGVFITWRPDDCPADAPEALRSISSGEVA